MNFFTHTIWQIRWIKFSFLLATIIFLAFVLRIYQVTRVPPGLYSDEVSIGYNAYSILKTGRDEHGVFLPLWFKAFGEYKLPVYIYLTTASEFFFGKNDLAVRLPSVLAGIGSVVVFSFLLFYMTKSSKFALLGGLLLAVSPWHLQFSRAAFEANLALFWVLLGTSFIIWGLRQGKLIFWGGVLFLLISLYTYNIERIFTPLFLLSLLVLLKINIRKFISRSNVWVGVILFLFTLPFIVFAVSKEGLIRAGSESFIHDVKITSDDFFRNLNFLRFHQYLENYLSYYSFDFLFFSGDQTGRHSVREMGMTYLWQLPFLIIGFFTAIKKRGEAEEIFLAWLFLTPLGAAAARPNPHALRGLLLIPPLVFFTDLGLYKIISFLANFRYKLIVQGVFCALVSYFLLLYLHIYYVHYPNRTAIDWASGYKEMIEYLYQNKDKYQKILLTKRFMSDYIYLLFYGNFDPATYFNSKGGFGKYIYVKSPYAVRLEDKTLYASPFWEERKERLLTKIYALNGEKLFKIWAN